MNRPLGELTRIAEVVAEQEMRMRAIAGLLGLIAMVAATSALAAATLPADGKAEKIPTAVQWVADYDTAMQAAKKANKPVLVDFHTEWCGYCDRMDREVLSVREVVKLSVKFVSVKVDGDREKPIADKYGVHSYPSYLFLAPDGSVLYSSIGYMPAEPFAVRMRRALQVLKDLPERRQLQAKYAEGTATPEEMARLGYLLRQAGRNSMAAEVLDGALQALSAESPERPGAQADKLILDVRATKAGSMGALEGWIGANDGHALRWEAQYELGLAQANSDDLRGAANTLREVARHDIKSDIGIMADFYVKIIDEIVNVPVGGG